MNQYDIVYYYANELIKTQRNKVILFISNETNVYMKQLLEVLFSAVSFTEELDKTMYYAYDRMEKMVDSILE